MQLCLHTAATVLPIPRYLCCSIAFWQFIINEYVMLCAAIKTTNRLLLWTISAWVSEESASLLEVLAVAVEWLATERDAAIPYTTAHVTQHSEQKPTFRQQKHRKHKFDLPFRMDTSLCICLIFKVVHNHKHSTLGSIVKLPWQQSTNEISDRDHAQHNNKEDSIVYVRRQTHWMC